ncbi:hypothetical protein BDW66DRAFT_133322 [Aspergillus desertorum]
MKYIYSALSLIHSSSRVTIPLVCLACILFLSPLYRLCHESRFIFQRLRGSSPVRSNFQLCFAMLCLLCYLIVQPALMDLFVLHCAPFAYPFGRLGLSCAFAVTRQVMLT